MQVAVAEQVFQRSGGVLSGVSRLIHRCYVHMCDSSSVRVAAYDGQLNSAKAGRATKAASGGRAVSTTCKTSARASAGQVHHDGTDCFDNFDDASPTTFREKRRLKKAAQTQRAARQIVATAEARTADPEWAKMGKGKPKLTSEERSRRVAHKKLKLAARARFERTLQYANAATNTVSFYLLDVIRDSLPHSHVNQQAAYVLQSVRLLREATDPGRIVPRLWMPTWGLLALFLSS